MVSMEGETDLLCDWETVQHPEGLQYHWTEWEWEFERVPAVSDQGENKKVELWSFIEARKKRPDLLVNANWIRAAEKRALSFYRFPMLKKLYILVSQAHLRYFFNFKNFCKFSNFLRTKCLLKNYYTIKYWILAFGSFLSLELWLFHLSEGVENCGFFASEWCSQM